MCDETRKIAPDFTHFICGVINVMPPVNERQRQRDGKGQIHWSQALQFSLLCAKFKICNFCGPIGAIGREF